jgi:hypothetical protein
VEGSEDCVLGSVLNAKFAIECLVALALCAAIWGASVYYNRAGQTRKLDPDVLREPTGNVLTILGLMLPIEVGLLAYLYERSPSAPFTFLAASIACVLATLVLAIWETFALTGKPSAQGSITLTFPEDRPCITTLGFMYVLLLVGLVYLCAFMLTELAPNGRSGTPVSAATIQLSRPDVGLGLTQAEVIERWGRPEATSEDGTAWTYSAQSELRTLAFDSSGVLADIRVTRRIDDAGK